MKKIIIVILVMTMVVLLTGCNKTNNWSKDASFDAVENLDLIHDSIFEEDILIEDLSEEEVIEETFEDATLYWDYI